MLVFQRDPLLKGAIRKNELSGKIDIVGNLGWQRTSSNLTDTDVYQIHWYLEKNYGLKNDRNINKAMNIVASENKSHPIRECLEKIKWDGQPRIDNLLPRYLGADHDDYTKEIMRLLMLAAIRRVYEPGCKFEIMVCLVGGQGAGKSTFFRFLAVNDEWFSDDLKRMDDDNAYRKMQGHWIIEMSEMMATVNAKSIEDIKSFISRQKPLGESCYFNTKQCVAAWLVLSGMINVMILFLIAGYLNYHWSVGLLQVERWKLFK